MLKEGRIVKSKLIVGIVLTLLLTGMLSFTVTIQQVNASGTIYIKADGSVDPPTANITSSDNITYYFTDSNYDSVVIEKDNIVVDGAGYTLQGPGSGHGFTLNERNNVTIKNTIVKGWTTGIWASYCGDISISNNTVTSNDQWGIVASAYSSGNNISDNTVNSNGKDGIALYYHSDGNTVSDNEVTSNHRYGVVASNYSCGNNISGNTVTSNVVGGIILYEHSSDNNITSNTVTSNVGNGIMAGNYSSGNTISGNTVTSNGEWGIFLFDHSGSNTITGNTVNSNGLTGIVTFLECHDNTIMDNRVWNNSLSGIFLRISGGNTLRNNNMTCNKQNNFGVYSELNRVSDYVQDIDASNIVDGKPVYYWVNQRDRQIPADAGCVQAVNCVNITVEDLNLTKSAAGVRFVNTTDSTIRNVTALNNNFGIHLILSSGNTISGSTITSLGWYRNFTDLFFGPPGWMWGWGIGLLNSSSNTMSGNTITNNDIGISLLNCSSNTIYHNNFVNNTVQANVTSGCVNTWDNSYPSGGNYWSNYTDVDLYSGPYQNETGSDGIWDHPYVLDTNNTDRYPLMIPRMKAVVHTVWSEILNVTSSWNDTDPGFGVLPLSGECNATISPPDVNGVRNMTVPKGSGYIKPAYNPISNITIHSVSISDSYGKLYTIDGVGDVDIISMTNDTGMFFKYWMDGTWHVPTEEWLGDGDPDPAGSAWFTGMLNVSHYLGNGTDGPLIGSYLSQFWLTTGFSKNTVDEPNSRLNGFSVNATGVPFLSPYVGSIGTYVSAGARLNTPFGGEHLDVQSKTDQLQVTPKAIMFTLFSPANLHVTDPINRHIGADPTTGEYVNEIPGASYSGPGSHPQRIVIPDPVDGVYDIKIVGTSTGEYTLVVELATVEKITTNTYTGDIAAGQILESEANISEDEMTFTPPSLPVGGISIPVNKLSLLAPYIALTALLAVAVVTVSYVKKRKRHTETIS